MIIINIGLETNDGATLDHRAAAIAVIGRARAAITCGVKQSDTEPTLVMVADALSDGAARIIAAELRQDCIAVYDTNTRRGRLLGPKAEAWGAFNPAYFIMPSGARLDNSYAALIDGAAAGMGE